VYIVIAVRFVNITRYLTVHQSSKRSASSEYPRNTFAVLTIPQ